MSHTYTHTHTHTYTHTHTHTHTHTPHSPLLRDNRCSDTHPPPLRLSGAASGAGTHTPHPEPDDGGPHRKWAGPGGWRWTESHAGHMQAADECSVSPDGSVLQQALHGLNNSSLLHSLSSSLPSSIPPSLSPSLHSSLPCSVYPSFLKHKPVLYMLTFWLLLLLLLLLPPPPPPPPPPQNIDRDTPAAEETNSTDPVSDSGHDLQESLDHVISLLGRLSLGWWVQEKQLVERLQLKPTGASWLAGDSLDSCVAKEVRGSGERYTYNVHVHVCSGTDYLVTV